MRKNPPLYKRNKGQCRRCHGEVGPFAVIHLDNISFHYCHACQIKTLLITEAPSPKKKRVSVSEIPENEEMATIQRGLADAEQGRTSAVRLDSPFIP